ncbi:hypothetical protein GCM10011399_01610 [Subtercola lobariae]|uniref:Uncharacterized protein n=1 Tax=Subtercola lobariae TaxID=1588641 RepID=A0A917EVA9_9MICO|nr:hypothetical protein GCM10011399_01610 [Subtercola lobariae]
MLRSDFENHPLWELLRESGRLVSEILDEGDPSDVASLEVVSIIQAHLWSFHKQRARNSTMFTARMLIDTQAAWQGVVDHLTSRSAINPDAGAEVAAAAASAELALLTLAPWPRLFAAPAEAEREQTIFEDLLEAQRLSIASLGISHGHLREEIDEFIEETTRVKDEAIAELSSTTARAVTLEGQLVNQAARVDSAVDRAEATTSELRKKDDDAWEAWVAEARVKFDERFDPLLNEIGSKLTIAQERLTELEKTEGEFKALASASAADKLAGHYKKEADSGRSYGIRLYIGGVAALLLGAIPLVLSAFGIPHEISSSEWQEVAIRLSIGALFVTAATVAIKLGADFFREATKAKRMELEMRTIGPFLSTVADRTEVDRVQLAIVESVFGQGYSIQNVDAKDETVNVTAVGSLLDSLTKLFKTTSGS